MLPKQHPGHFSQRDPDTCPVRRSIPWLPALCPRVGTASPAGHLRHLPSCGLWTLGMFAERMLFQSLVAAAGSVGTMCLPPHFSFGAWVLVTLLQFPHLLCTCSFFFFFPPFLFFKRFQKKMICVKAVKTEFIYNHRSFGQGFQKRPLASGIAWLHHRYMKLWSDWLG